MVSYENFYYGSESIMPQYNTIGYEIPLSDLATSVDPRTANQLREINTKINPGIGNVEVQGISAKVWESVPEQHLEEINRLMKLTGTKPSFHAPILEASGVGERGWDEANREAAERQLESAALRSHKLDPEGNISVTFHSTAQLPEMRPITITGEGKERKEVAGPTWVIDQTSGQIAQLPKRKTYFPEQGEFKGEEPKFNPEQELIKLNNDHWLETLSQVNRFSGYGEQIIKEVFNPDTPEKQQALKDFLSASAKGINIDRIEDSDTKNQLKQIERQVNHGRIYTRDTYNELKKLFDKAYAASSGDDREKLTDFANEIAPIVKGGIEKNPEKLPEFTEVIEKGLKILGEIQAPQSFKPLNDFVLDKSAQTFANVATSSFEKFGDTAPLINIENPPAGGGLSKAEDLRKLVEVSREKFQENMVKKGMSKGEAKAVSEKMIGATWDVGHINMLRKFGYTEEDIVKQTKEIAPVVKHIHLSDNFGMDHTELPMGMGNVPIKEIMQELDKKSPLKGKTKKVIEAGDWWQFFAEQGGGNPIKPTIENFNSPLYSMYAAPGWNQVGGYGAYFSGHGAINPQVHHSLYGAGFSTLPAELGGQITGPERGRFASGG